MAKERNKFIDDLEKVGEKEIRHRFISGKYGHGQPDNQIYWIIKSWLDSKEAARAEAREETMLFTAQEANSVAREANSIASKARSEARRANRIAISAAIIAALSMITTIIIAVLT